MGHACGQTIRSAPLVACRSLYKTNINMETETRNQTSARADKPVLNPDALDQLLGQMVNRGELWIIRECAKAVKLCDL